jgi:hypothetical protein
MSAYIEKEYGSLVGRKIVAVRQLKKSELDMFMWDTRSADEAVMFILDDGSVMIPSMDPEGNGPGHVFVEKLGPTL